MPIRKLRNFLDEHRIKYVVVSHSTAYTAQEEAALAHISGRELAKTIMIKIDGVMAMAVLPASDHIDFDLVREAVEAERVELAGEEEFQDLFPDCELGAMPPFGNLYNMEVYAAGTLAEDEEIAFNAGNHRELIKMAYRDFARLVRPKVVNITAVPVG